MIVDVSVVYAWALKHWIKNVLLPQCLTVVGAAQLEGRASGFVEANMKK